MNSSFKKQLTKIYWFKEAGKTINVTNAEMNQLLIRLRAKGCKKATTKFDRSEWMFGEVFRTEKKNHYRYLYVNENGKFKVYATNIFDDNRNTGTIRHPGAEAAKQFHNYFKEKNGITFKTAYGYPDESFKRCVPKQFVYVNNYFRDTLIPHLSGIDGCAQYLSNLRGDLPDYHTAKRIEGYVKPSEEYPFAMYLNSGHLAEYNKFDTHDWLDSPFLYDMFNGSKKYVRDEKEITILMKPSKYKLNETLEYFYDRRKIDPEAKLVVNAAIGYMHRRNYASYKLAHLAAFAIARANDSVLKLACEIGPKKIVQICVDGIIYYGDERFGKNQKSLGSYYQEFIDCTGIVRGANAYIAMKDGKLIKMKHGAYNINKDGTPIDENKIKCPEQVYDWDIDRPDLSKDEECYGELDTD